MNSQDININTKVEDILADAGVNQKGFMSRLAMTVFDKFSGQTIKAFTQFAPKDLAVVIEARRKGVFDYGLCFRDTDAGTTWPSDPKAVLAAIDLAVENKVDQIDFKSLGLLDANGNPSVDIKKLCPASAAGKKAAPKQEPDKKDNVVPFNKPADPEPPKELPPPADEKPAEPEKKTRKKKEQAALPPPPLDPSTEGESVPAAPAGEVIAPIIARIDKLAADLADSFDTVVAFVKETDQKRASVIEDEIGYVKNEVENVKAGLIGLFGCVEVMDRNMRQILMFTFGDAVTFEDLPEGAESMLKCAVPDDLAERVEKVEKEQPPKVEEKPAEPVKAPDTTLHTYTKEELEAMDLGDLREYGAKLGLEPAKWGATMVNRILEEYKRRGIEV